MLEIASGITMDGSTANFTPFANADEPEGDFLEFAEKAAA